VRPKLRFVGGDKIAMADSRPERIRAKVNRGPDQMAQARQNSLWDISAKMPRPPPAASAEEPA
jgi:hypothetical protein